MKKSIVLASLLFSTSVFATNWYSNQSVCSELTHKFPPRNKIILSSGCSSYTPKNVHQYSWNGSQCIYIYKPTCNANNTGLMYNSTGQSNGYSCPSGYSFDSQGVCTINCSNGSSYDINTNTCLAPPLSSFDNDPAGCASAGGYYFNDGSCLDGSDAIAKVFTDPTAIVGSLIFLNGAAWSIAGAYALPITGGASSAAIAYGGHAMAAGLATLAVSAAGQLYNQPDTVTPKSDSTTGETRIKVKLQSDNSTTVAQGDISSGKVESISYIPPEVKQRILEGVVNPTTGLPNITQSDLAGTTVTKYNYTNNTATTESIKSDGTTVTTVTPFTPITNTDGSVTAQSHNESVAPTVTGTKSSTWAPVPEWNQYQTIAQWTETIKTNTGTGSTSGGGSTGTTPVSTGDATADAIVNAKMPAYDQTGTGSFDTLDKSVVTDMQSSATGLFDNIQSQIDAAQTVYDQTSSLISGGWEAPQIPAGECGTSMSMDFNGKHIDVCPPLANFLAPLSPIISFLITLAGTAFAISIFLGGF